MGQTLVHELVEVEVVVAEEGEGGCLRQEASVDTPVGAGEDVEVVCFRTVSFLDSLPAYQAQAVLHDEETLGRGTHRGVPGRYGVIIIISPDTRHGDRNEYRCKS